MADNTPITDASSVVESIATDDVGGVKYQRVKVNYGTDGSATDVSSTNPLPVTATGTVALSSSGTNNVVVVTAPDAADTTDSIAAAVQVRKVKNGLVDATPAVAFANVAAGSTDSVLKAATTGKSVVVLALAFVCGATATTATFNSKPAGAGTAISPLFANAANGGAVLPFNPAGWFFTNAGEGLSVTTGAGSATGILVTYVLL